MRAARVRELRALVADSTLAGKGKGSHLKTACGSFYDWLGEPVPVVPGELHAQVQEYTGPFELPEPDEDVRAIVQRIIDNEVKHLRLS